MSLWKFSALCSRERILQIDHSRIDKVIAMVRVAPFFNSQCIILLPENISLHHELYQSLSSDP